MRKLLAQSFREAYAKCYAKCYVFFLDILIYLYCNLDGTHECGARFTRPTGSLAIYACNSILIVPSVHTTQPLTLDSSVYFRGVREYLCPSLDFVCNPPLGLLAGFLRFTNYKMKSNINTCT